MPYYDTPLAANRINATQPLIRANFGAINGGFTIDHIPFDAPGDIGKHKKVTLVQQPAPVFGVGEIGFYNLAGALLYHNLAGANLDISTKTAQSVTLPSGLIIKYGVQGGAGANGPKTIAYVAPFPTVCYTVVISVYDAALGFNQYYAALQSYTVNDFIVKRFRIDTGATSNFGFSWIALGA